MQSLCSSALSSIVFAANRFTYALFFFVAIPLLEIFFMLNKSGSIHYGFYTTQYSALLQQPDDLWVDYNSTMLLVTRTKKRVVAFDIKTKKKKWDFILFSQTSLVLFAFLADAANKQWHTKRIRQHWNIRLRFVFCGLTAGDALHS